MFSSNMRMREKSRGEVALFHHQVERRVLVTPSLRIDVRAMLQQGVNDVTRLRLSVDDGRVEWCVAILKLSSKHGV